MRRTGIAAAALAAAAVAAAPAHGAVKITTTPGLFPPFSRHVSDYVIRCQPGKPVRVDVDATGGDRVKVGGKHARGGRFERHATREPDAALTIGVRRHGTTRDYHVRCLPKDFPAWQFESHGRAQAQWYLIAPVGAHAYGYMALFDRRGVPVWWWHSTSWAPWDGKLLPDGRIAFARFFNDHFGLRGSLDAYEVRRLDGALVRLVRTPGQSTDTHDMQEMPNGDYLVDTYIRRDGADLSPRGGPKHATVYDCQIEEVTPAGKVVWRWNTKNHIPLSWTTGDDTSGWWAVNGHRDENGHRDTYDLVHVNSMEPDGDGLIVSARHTDSVFEIDRATGKIEWKLGGTHVPGKSLKVLGAPRGFGGERLFSGQHDARLWKDGSLTVFDNGSQGNRPPVADRFEIDAAHHTARLVERITNPEAKESVAMGSARKLDAGNWVVDWGGLPLVTEQTPGGRVVRRFWFSGWHFSYRAVGIEPGRLSAKSLRRGMDRMVAARRTAEGR